MAAEHKSEPNWPPPITPRQIEFGIYFGFFLIDFVCLVLNFLSLFNTFVSVLNFNCTYQVMSILKPYHAHSPQKEISPLIRQADCGIKTNSHDTWTRTLEHCRIYLFISFTTSSYLVKVKPRLLPSSSSSLHVADVMTRETFKIKWPGIFGK